MRIVFMGTPEFAVPSLAALLAAGYEVVAAVTQPDRPSGRGNRLAACPVKAYAQAQGVAVLQFERLRRPQGVQALQDLSPDLFVTAAYGQILSQQILDIPPLGTVNVHASLLPRYRGPAPINWCIINGEADSGVTTMLTDAGVDTGDMLLQRRTPIGPDETAGELTARLSELGAEVLIETLRARQAGALTPTPQDAALATRQPMLSKETGRIDWTGDSACIANLVRGVNPWPGAWTTLADGGVLKIWQAHPAQGSGQPGEILRADAKGGLLVACGAGALEIESMQAPGTRRMDAKAYLLGHSMQTGLRLGAQEA